MTDEPRICPAGHEISGSNLYRSPNGNDKGQCRTCRKAAVAKHARKVHPLQVAPLKEYARAGSLRKLAALIGVSYKTVDRWTRQGVPFYSADAAATKLGVHMTQIWGFNSHTVVGWDDYDVPEPEDRD